MVESLSISTMARLALFVAGKKAKGQVAGVAWLGTYKDVHPVGVAA